MTLGLYLDYCDACYRANYPQRSWLSQETGETFYELDDEPKAKYRKMADGRHEGLTELPLDDPSAFDRWYRERSGIGHPWEIFRGGNSTHVNLAPYKMDGGYRITLQGINRFEEIARSVIALQGRGLPFELEKADSFTAMATGDDFVGILPYWHLPRYAQGEFPKEDAIETFMNLPWDKKDIRAIRKAISWYPL
jgi:hypothetical protein